MPFQEDESSATKPVSDKKAALKALDARIERLGRDAQYISRGKRPKYLDLLDKRRITASDSVDPLRRAELVEISARIEQIEAKIHVGRRHLLSPEMQGAYSLQLSADRERRELLRAEEQIDLLNSDGRDGALRSQLASLNQQKQLIKAQNGTPFVLRAYAAALKELSGAVKTHWPRWWKTNAQELDAQFKATWLQWLKQGLDTKRKLGELLVDFKIAASYRDSDSRVLRHVADAAVNPKLTKIGQRQREIAAEIQLRKRRRDSANACILRLNKQTLRETDSALVLAGAPKDLGVYRAMLVETIRREMIEITNGLELAEDYETRVRNNEAFANFKTVAVCNRHPALLDKLCVINTTKKPKIVEIACEIAARSTQNAQAKPVLARTFKDAHKRYGFEARKRLDDRLLG